jgi:hypothetical protein
VQCPVSIDDLGKSIAEEGGATDNAYLVTLPNPSADFVLEGERHNSTFVEYLRLAFQWGGFPGWERYENRPQEELDYLRTGLAPM